MLRALRSFRTLRRCLTLVVALAFPASAIELVVPDVHDQLVGVVQGDAAVATATGVSALEINESAATTSRDGMADFSQESCSRAHDGGCRAPASGTQTPHAEHCCHAHAATTPRAVATVAAAHLISETPVTPAQMLESITPPRALRPPIA